MKKMSMFLAMAAIALVSCNSAHEAKTVSLLNENDSLNYALGYANGAQIKMYYLRNDSSVATVDEFLNALENGYQGKVKELSQIERTGENIGQTVKSWEKIGLAEKAEWQLKEDVFFQGLVNGFYKDTTVMTATAAQSYFQTKYMATAPTEGKVAKAVTAKCGTKAKAIALKNEIDSLNYAFGYFTGEDLASQFLATDSTGADMKNLISAINAGLKTRVNNPQLVAMGESIGKAIKEQEGEGLLGIADVNTNFALIMQGFINALNGYEEQMNLQEASDYVQKTIDALRYGDTQKQGEEFLAANKLREGVITTESGLQYEVIRMGKGPKPTADSKVRVHYEGTLLSGEKFDSSYDRNEPAEFGVTQVIQGWTEALQLMPVGSEFKLYIPYNLAYGERGAGADIPPYSTLIFKVELLGIVK